MYVCVCNAFTDKQVRQVLNQGVRSTSGVYRAIGCRPQCGRCVSYIRQMIQDHEETVAAYAIAAE